MRRNGKRYTAAVMAMVFAACMGTAATAGTWHPDVYGAGTWAYSDTNGIGAGSAGWKWLDGNKDGVYESYYFDANGLMQANGNFDGFAVNADGQWTENGAVQRRELPDWLSAAPERYEGNGMKLIYPKLAIAGSTALTDAANEAVDALVFAAQHPSEGDMAYGATENDMDYDLVLSRSGKYVGLSVQNYTYAAGAAHGFTAERYLTLTPEKGVLKLSDLGGSALEQRIVSGVKSALQARVDAGDLMLFDNADQVQVDLSAQNWMLADDGLHVVFQPYDIAPYAAGNVDVSVPYSALVDSMNDYGRELVS